jgi:hypothetical protein
VHSLLSGVGPFELVCGWSGSFLCLLMEIVLCLCQVVCGLVHGLSYKASTKIQLTHVFRYCSVVEDDACEECVL